MIYRAIGLMSGSSLDGLDVAMVELEEIRGKWEFAVEAAATIDYEPEWRDRLQSATTLTAREYLLLHADYGHYLGRKVNAFIVRNALEHRVQLIASHGHTTFHEPAKGMTAQLGDGAAIAAETGINVVSDLRALDVALGGQGAPIVPVGEKYLFAQYPLLLNLGGIANISIHDSEKITAFDICPANKILNLLAAQKGLEYDKDGALAKGGNINTELLTKLNALEYYKFAAPKSLANHFGTDIIFPLIEKAYLPIEDAARTYVEHIAMQVGYSIATFKRTSETPKILLAGGGALNLFLVERITEILAQYGIETVVPSTEVIAFKEAIIMAFLGVLRWREENTVLSSVTGASRNSIGGAVWIGQEY